ncbi:MAG: Lrp/AsnC family transcriptional regulator [Candidatus Micrarchaeota archaeon]|nr:Lrp/AsnC family transcriptional regulator [Planctomycetota bacterium]MDE1822863.1 Lrp/AsnC family transcriptional regulator [Candidatus Micrarchaeota archaeon]MDE1849508.1 Lrp/AsnC family transcriptional regulator [Candidatus Micrarchaeota archaeon]
MKLDKLDMRILELLQESSMLSPRLSKIAEKADTTNATIYRRIEAMRKEGIIIGHTTRIDSNLISRKLEALIYIKLQRNASKDDRDRVSTTLYKSNNVDSLYVPIGSWNFIIKTGHQSLDELSNFIRDEIDKLPVNEMRVEIISKTMKESQGNIPEKA